MPFLGLLSGLGGKILPYAALAAAALAVFLLIRHELDARAAAEAKAAALAEQLDDLQAINRQDTEMLDRLQSEQAKALAAVAAYHAQAQAAARTLADLRVRLAASAAVEGHDGPIAPALREVLEGLRPPQPPAAPIGTGAKP